MQYSYAYYPDGEETLEQAQLTKKRHNAAKLNLKDGHKVLDIGCGWGCLTLYLSQITDVEVLGVSLSRPQVEIASERAKLAGLSQRVKFQLCDYRELRDKFDRIVLVGMLEHVGISNLDEFF